MSQPASPGRLLVVLALAFASSSAAWATPTRAIPASATEPTARDVESAPESPGPTIVLALPLAAGSGSQPEWLSAGIAEFLAEAFAAAGREPVDRVDRDDALEEAGLADESRVTLASACEVARRVGAAIVLTGTWSVKDGLVEVKARAIDVGRLKLAREGRAAAPLALLGPSLGSLAVQLVGDADPAAKAAIERLAGAPSAALMPWMQAAGEPEMARKHLESSLLGDPRFVPALLDLAENRLDEGAPEDVLRLLARVPAAAPQHQRVRAQVLHGRALLATGGVTEAVRVLTDAVRARPGREALVWLAEAQIAAQDGAAAATSARRVLEMAPGDEQALDLLDRASAEPEGVDGSGS